MVCFSTNSGTSLHDFIELCAESGTALPEVLEFAVQSPFAVGETLFDKLETVDGRAPSQTCVTVQGSDLEEMLAAGGSACRMQV